MGSHTRMLQINRADDWLNEHEGWTQDSQALTRLVDSLFCTITCSLENNAFSVLQCCLTLLYVTSIRVCFCPWNSISHGPIRLAPLSLASSRGCLCKELFPLALLCWLVRGFFVLIVVRHSWVSQVFTPRIGEWHAVVQFCPWFKIYFPFFKLIIIPE